MFHPQHSAADQHEFQISCAMCPWHTAFSSAPITMMAVCNVVDVSEANRQIGVNVRPYARKANVQNVCAAQTSPYST
jgi:hypothetical protein